MKYALASLSALYGCIALVEVPDALREADTRLWLLFGMTLLGALAFGTAAFASGATPSPPATPDVRSASGEDGR